jgi:hypothetical protein
MEMCYDGALVMPRNYAVISEDEMIYLDGGGAYQKGVYYAVEFAANCAFNAALGGGSISCLRTVLKSLGRSGFERVLARTLTKWISARIANRIAARCSNIITGFASFSVGGAIAEGLDRLDGCNDNQIYFSRIFG